VSRSGTPRGRPRSPGRAAVCGTRAHREHLDRLGWLPFVVACLALVVLVGALDWRSGGLRRQLGRGSPIAALVTGAVALVLTLALLVPSDFPWSAYAWGFAFVLAVCVAQYEEATQAETIDILFGGSEASFAAHDPARLLRGRHFAGLAGWFEVGDQDVGPLGATQSLQSAALRAGVATCTLVRPGGHDFDLWIRALEDSFPWLAWRLGLTPAPAHEPATCTSP
jgi:hypothetical protein